MSHESTLHIMPSTSRNTTRLISFMDGMDFTKKQKFLVYGPKVERVKFSDSQFDVGFINGNLIDFFKEFPSFFSARKIVVHGFFNLKLMVFFVFFPILLRKVYWVVWGRDLYSVLASPSGLLSSLRKIISKYIFRKILYIVTYIPGDYFLVKKNFNEDARFVNCLMYPGNLYKEFDEVPGHNDSEIRILVGNSGTPSNNHIRIFERLSENMDCNKVKIYCPLSYGDHDYIEKVRQAGFQYFGKRFVSLERYMDMEQYVKFLATIDYAVFDYDRQQGMGNIISLLGLGKGVFLNPETTPWDFFKNEEIHVFDINEIDSFNFDVRFNSDNAAKVKAKFSESVLKSQLYEIFD